MESPEPRVVSPGDDDLFAAAIAAVPTAIAVVDAAGRLVACNPALTALAAGPGVEASNFDRLFSFVDQPSVRQSLQQARLAPAVCRARLTNLRSVDLTARPIRKPGQRTLIAVQVVPRCETAIDPDSAAEINHDLRTPLNAIAGFADILRGDLLGQGLSPRYRDYAKDIADAAATLLRAVDGLFRNAPADQPAPPRPDGPGKVVGFARPAKAAAQARAR